MEYLEKVKTVIAPYGPDDGGCYSKMDIGILYRAFHTTRESRRETQPHITESGAVIVWDGRLDNRADLIRQLRDVLRISSTDVSIVAAAYEEWGTDCFAKLIGDWALSIWDPRVRSLILAKDPIGTRCLFYSFDNEQVIWGTILDPLILFAGKAFALCEEYIAGWLGSFPATHLTPYIGVHSVPPSSSVVIGPGKHTVSRYWDFVPGKRIHYRRDAEYEEHFRSVFSEAVRRRLRSDMPILAELSGGMDSSAIVCMADKIITRGAAETPRLDTVSYYDDSEPNWNERPYFTKVEEKRGRTGCHIDVGNQESCRFELDSDHFAATPGSAVSHSSVASRQFAAYVNSQENRVVLSGIGGDEVTGGVPTPIPEIEDLLARGHFRTLAHQLKLWALNKKKPWFHLFFEAVQGFFPPALVGVPKHKRPAPWLNSGFIKRNRSALQGYQRRLELFGALPSFQDNLSTLDILRRQLACAALPSEPVYEKRYAYLDRDLLEFMYSVPREQLLRPGQRRSLMRRALVGIVPGEILHRRRKAFTIRRPIYMYQQEWITLQEYFHNSVSEKFHYLHDHKLVEKIADTIHGKFSDLVPMSRIIALELWLRRLPIQTKVCQPTTNRGESGFGRLLFPASSSSERSMADRFRAS